MILESFYEREKEVAILDIIKNASKERENLTIRIEGKYEPWVKKWIIKHGHRLVDSNPYLTIIVNRPVDKEKIEEIRRSSSLTALIHPSPDSSNMPLIKENVKKDLLPPKDSLDDATIQSFCYGLGSISYFGFKNTASDNYTLTIIMGALALFILLSLPADPPDDLLRHMKAYEYGFDYSKLYINAWNFSFNPYPIFDNIAGLFDQHFGEIVGFKGIQALCFLAFFIGFALNTRHWNDGFRALIFVILLAIIDVRIVLSRPADFEGFFLLIGLALSGAPAVIFGSFMGFMYYLFPIYLIPLALVKREYLISMVVSLVFWIIYAGENYFTDIYIFFSNMLTNRSMGISENGMMLIALGSVFFLLLLYMFIKSRNLRYAWPIGFFTIINQIRYISVLAPLLAISIDEKKLGINRIKLGLLEKAFIFGIMIALVINAFPDYEIEEIRINDSKVLCASMRCMFNTVYYGDNLSITPSMEIGNTDKEIQKAIKKALNEGEMDCSIFEKYDYDLVVESNLKEIPECLELIDVERKYRIWKVKK